MAQHFYNKKGQLIATVESPEPVITPPPENWIECGNCKYTAPKSKYCHPVWKCPMFYGWLLVVFATLAVGFFMVFSFIQCIGEK